MYINIDEWIGNIFWTIVIIGIFWLLIWLSPRIGYHFNKSTCSVYINNREVYSGYCHFVKVRPLGELGTSKEVTIYKDVNCWYPKQIYVSDQVEVKELKDSL